LTIKTSDFDYDLPVELIAQTPIEPRDHSRLLVLNRASQTISHHHFYDIIDFLRTRDVLIYNESRVIPARLKGKKSDSGGKVEILLLQRVKENIWEAMIKPGKSLKTGSTVDITDNNDELLSVAKITDIKDEGIRIIQFDNEEFINKIGEIPLPPYIHTPLIDKERYQTVYAKIDGSVAAPTAGLHFTRELIEAIKLKGIIFTPVTLHIGLDTFQPVREEDPQQHIIHREFGTIGEETARQISLAKAEGRRVVCIGTTATRIVEHAAQKKFPLDAYTGWVDLFILPGHKFLLTDAMITNFHLPKTTLLMLVSAFAGKDLIDRAYSEAIKERYRFYSFGDATLIS
jgi:S-adenosylmethionine:tRNA ribosyltransferase-isomerase